MPARASVLAVGFFDGVHLGHRAILTGADEALTFANHPLTVLAPERAPRLVMSLDDRLAAIRACGVRSVTVLDFTRELAALSPEDFAARHLREKSVRCGANWRFGRSGAGDAAFLRARGGDVTVVPAVDHEGEPISSTRIRAALARGDLASAQAMLGRPFAVRCVPFTGKGTGATMGYPTINLRVDVPLCRGAYAVMTDLGPGVANYGLAPTFGPRAWTEDVLEVHLFEAPSAAVPSGDVRTVTFRAFLRPERTFASGDALRDQIAEDILRAQACRF